MDELAALDVEYQALDGQEKKGHVDEAKRRELGLRKVQFYNKYNLGAAILKVPKSKMPAYLAFWPNFWKRVDQFQKENPGLEGPGPFQLPRESRMSALRDGAISVAQGVGDLVRVREAAAAVGKVGQSAPGTALVDDYPNCSHVINERPFPTFLQCEPNDKPMTFDYAYFEQVTVSNYILGGDDTKPAKELYTKSITKYKDDRWCDYDREEKRRVQRGSVRAVHKVETSRCGKNAGDNAGQRTKTTEVNYTREVSDFKEGTIHYGTYCLDRASDPETFRRYQEVWAQEVKLEEEPEWIYN